MRDVPVTVIGEVDPTLLERRGPELRQQRTLAEVLTWSRAQRPPHAVTEIVTQDEYTHDVIVPLDERHYLAFDTT